MKRFNCAASILALMLALAGPASGDAPSTSGWALEVVAGMTDDIWGVTYANSTFAAVTNGGRLLSSADGVNWTAQTIASDTWLLSVTYNAGLWVVVGDKGTILYSSDMKTWSTASSGTTSRLNGIYYADNLVTMSNNPRTPTPMFVAVGENGAYLTSPDGKTWSPLAPGFASWLRGVASSTLLDSPLATGANLTVDSQATGQVWSTASSANGYEAIVPFGTSISFSDHVIAVETYYAETFIAVGDNGSSAVVTVAAGGLGTAQIGYYGPGATVGIAPVSAYSGTLRGLTVANGFAVAAGDNGTVVESPDGMAWSTVLSGAATGALTTQALYCAAYSGTLDKIVVAGAAGTIVLGNSTPSIAAQPQSATVSAASSVTLTVQAAGSGVSYQWYLDGLLIPGATAASLSIPDVEDNTAGSYTVTVASPFGSVASTAAVVSLKAPQALAAAPASVDFFAASPPVFSNGLLGFVGLVPAFTVLGSGALEAKAQQLTSSSFGGISEQTIDFDFTSATSGYYSDIDGGSILTGTFSLGKSAWLTNLSARAPVQGGQNILIAGFVTAGPGSKSLLIRGDGPALAGFGITGFLSDPDLTLLNAPGTTLVTANSWSAGLVPTFKSVGAFALTAGSHDDALAQTVAPGAYTAQISSATSNSGVAIAEIYDADTGAPTNRLINLSARALVQTGSNILIGGFVIGGTGQETVLIRADGPALSAFGISNALNNPVLTLYNASGVPIATNIGWGNQSVSGNGAVSSGPSATTLQPTTAAIFSQVGAFTLQSGSADSAMVITLPAGSYTAQVAGANGGTGVSLIEIYEVQ
jgi:hypothetical protein